MKVLVIDDDPNVNQLICKILKQENHTFQKAFNGVEGLKILHEYPDFDLIICDIIMPEKEGIETIREARSNYPDIKIIAISGGGKIGADNYLKLDRALGADYILEKPFTVGDMIYLLEKIK